ncbi:unnamed protein product [Somion occarium]|uniref:Uncharacterized protein n=1 Tax=Somion occarium TaxID=3059160 RepID=A0ABP1CP07_9APHY
MASAHIKALLGGPSTADSHRQALDFLNSHYKSYHDLEQANDFDDILEDSRKYNAELHTKFISSQQHVDGLIAQTRESAQQHLHTAQELSLLRHSLTDELSYLSEQLVSTLSDPDSKPTLLEEIETTHRSLKELESVKSYVKVIEHALHLSELAVKRASNSSSPLQAIPDYEKVQKFVASVGDASKDVEDGSGQQKLHLLTFLEDIREKTWRDIKSVLKSTLLNVAEKLQWPNAIDYRAASVEDRKAFESAFSDLTKFQTIGEKLHPLNKPKDEKDGLYPIQALIQPIALRFKYHFESNRQTNRLDKPEWYFTHILNVAHEHRTFMENIVQQLLTSTRYKHINAWREFTLLLLPMLSRKLRRTVPSLIAHPPVLAHTIYQALSFDSALKEEGFELRGTSAAFASENDAPPWEGISEVILGKKEWFEAWMEGERQFAMDQYMEIISSPDAWLTADDDVEEEDDGRVHPQLKATNSARRVKALVEQVTDRYSPLPQFSHRTRFLIAVQLPLLESYHARISSSLDAFETLSSSFMRAVPGALGEAAGRSNDPRRLTSGIEGIQRLCKALISAKYLSAAMEAWGEDVFFLELWAEINHKASLRSRAEAAASLPDPKSADAEVPEGTIFEELVVQYNQLVVRAEELIVQSICNEVESGLKAHFNSGDSSQFTPVPSSGSVVSDDLALSSTLLGPVALLSAHLTFLQSALPQTTVISLYRTVASRLATHILHRQILYRGRSRITPQQGRTEASWRGLLEAGRIVGADGETWRKLVDSTFGTLGDEEWEKVLSELVGFSELSREDVGQVIQARVDSER